MNLLAAKPMLVRERMDWNRPHLHWLPKALYFNKRAAKRK